MLIKCATMPNKSKTNRWSTSISIVIIVGSDHVQKTIPFHPSVGFVFCVCFSCLDCTVVLISSTVHNELEVSLTATWWCPLQAEFESRCEMYEAQVTKMQRSLERGDTEKAKVEEDLAKAMALTAHGDRQVELTHHT